MRPGVKINRFSLFNDDVFAVHAGNINAINARKLCEDGVSCEFLFFTGCDGGSNFRNHFFSFADDKSINESGKRRGVKRAWAARDDQGVMVEAIAGLKRDSSHIQHVEHIGVG